MLSTSFSYDGRSSVPSTSRRPCCPRSAAAVHDAGTWWRSLSQTGSAGGLTRPTWNRPGCPRFFKLNSHKPERICHGIDVVRCRKNALAHARFPAPHLLPQGQHGASPRGAPGRPDLHEAPGLPAPLRCDNDFVWSLDQESVTQALQQMEAAWPEGEEHYAKLSVNALIGLWARNMDLIYTKRKLKGSRVAS